MKRRSFLFAGLSSLAVTQSARAKESLIYDGPEITRVVIYKKRRKLYLLSGTDVVQKFKIGLGFAPEGPKQFEGDGKTPEGSYFIDRRNPESSYHLSLGISYPNAEDIAFARSQGKRPGGDIFIHGRAGEHVGKGKDWTAGCIAVKDNQMETIYRMVRVGTQVDIFP